MASWCRLQHLLAAAAEPDQRRELLRFRAGSVSTPQHMSPLTLNHCPAGRAFTVSSMDAKIEQLPRGLGCGYIPETMVRNHLTRAG